MTDPIIIISLSILLALALAVVCLMFLKEEKVIVKKVYSKEYIKFKQEQEKELKLKKSGITNDFKKSKKVSKKQK